MASPTPAPQPAEIRLKGADRNLRRFVVPCAIAQHPLVATRYLYTFPERLLNLIVRHLERDRFDPQLLEMEKQVSALVGDHSVYVGIRREAPIAYGYLEPSKPHFSVDDVKHLGWGKSEQEIQEFLQIANPRLEGLAEPIRGFCGWLMTNRAFVAEHDQLIRQYADRIRDHDFPKPVLASFGSPMPQIPSDEPWVSAFRRFYSRWRLQSLVGPGLPMPLPVLGSSLPAVAVNLAAAEGAPSSFSRTSFLIRLGEFCRSPSKKLFTVDKHPSISQSGIVSSAGRIQPRTRSLTTLVCSAFNTFRGSFMCAIRLPCTAKGPGLGLPSPNSSVSPKTRSARI